MNPFDRLSEVVRENKKKIISNIVKSTLKIEVRKAGSVKYYKKIATGNPKTPWRYFYTKEEFKAYQSEKNKDSKKSLWDSVADYFKKSPKETKEVLKKDYKENNVKSSFGVTESIFMEHALEYFKNKIKWDLKFGAEPKDPTGGGGTGKPAGKPTGKPPAGKPKLNMKLMKFFYEKYGRPSLVIPESKPAEDNFETMPEPEDGISKLKNKLESTKNSKIEILENDIYENTMKLSELDESHPNYSELIQAIEEDSAELERLQNGEPEDNFETMPEEEPEYKIPSVETMEKQFIQLHLEQTADWLIGRGDPESISQAEMVKQELNNISSNITPMDIQQLRSFYKRIGVDIAITEDPEMEGSDLETQFKNSVAGEYGNEAVNLIKTVKNPDTYARNENMPSAVMAKDFLEGKLQEYQNMVDIAKKKSMKGNPMAQDIANTVKPLIPKVKEKLENFNWETDTVESLIEFFKNELGDETASFDDAVKMKNKAAKKREQRDKLEALGKKFDDERNEKIKEDQNNFETMPDSNPVKEAVQEAKEEIEKEKDEKQRLLDNAVKPGTKMIMKASIMTTGFGKKARSVPTPEEEVIITEAIIKGNTNELVYKYKSESSAGFAPASSFKNLPETDPEKIDELINEATPENRNETKKKIVGTELTEDEAEFLVEKNAAEIEFLPEKRDFGMNESGIKFKEPVLDYTAFPDNELISFKEKNVLNIPFPSYFPKIDLRYIQDLNYKLHAVELENGKLLIQTDEERIGSGPEGLIKRYALVSSDMLSSIENYAVMRERALYKQDYMKGLREDNPEATEKEIELLYKSYRKKRIGPRKAKNSMSYDNFNHISNHIYGRYVSKNEIEKFKNVFNEYRKVREYSETSKRNLKFNTDDRINNSTYVKGRETSYGDSGTVDDLLDTHGFKVKMQNGDPVSPEALEQVKTAADSVYGVFGSLKEMSKDFGMKVSHSGSMRMHASKEVGLFFPAMQSIGVSFHGGEKRAGLTFAHEVGHFIDYTIGKKYNKYHASESVGSLEYEIAETFKSGMKGDWKKKDYWTRSTECFARSMECYWLKKTNQRHKERDGANPDEKYFNEKVVPLIERFFEEKKDILKSILGKLK